ncbi:unnamed protein product [Adineta ricciae]|uniref:G-protein coupled receptors family 1 profile domain-containing protein n=1 Tax=Adineta ricciae TaxID=249248 RepID=A0A815M0Q7_ADIRI|nr:unnamed protein product [Adineta ricciae]
MLDETTLRIITRWLNYVVAIPFITLGIIGAILTVVIFTRQPLFWRNATITYLLAGATMTGIHLPMIYSQSILVNGFGLRFLDTNLVACREHNYLLYMTTVTAISFPCWAAFDQYVNTSRNANFRHRWSSIHFVRWVIVGTVIFWSLAYIPIIFVSEIIDGVCVLRPGAFTQFNTYFLTPFVYSVGPLIIIMLFTYGTAKNLRSFHGERQQDHLMKQVRRMLIPQLIVLGISGVPFGFQGIYLDLTSRIPKDGFRLALEDFFGQVILLLFHCNYVCTFYIYLCMSSEVRRVFKNLLLKCFRKNHIMSLQTATSEHQQHPSHMEMTPGPRTSLQ